MHGSVTNVLSCNYNMLHGKTSRTKQKKFSIKTLLLSNKGSKTRGVLTVLAVFLRRSLSTGNWGL